MPNNAGYPVSIQQQQQPGSSNNKFNPDEWTSANRQPPNQSPTNQYPDHRDYLPEQFGDPPSQQSQQPQQEPESPPQEEQQQPESPPQSSEQEPESPPQEQQQQPESQPSQQQPESPSQEQQQPESNVEQQLTNMDEDEIAPEDEDCNCKPVSSIFQCKQEGKFADKKNCKNFYRCTNDDSGGFIADQFECDMGNAFDESVGKCVPESQSKCKSGLFWI